MTWHIVGPQRRSSTTDILFDLFIWQEECSIRVSQNVRVKKDHCDNMTKPLNFTAEDIYMERGEADGTESHGV